VDKVLDEAADTATAAASALSGDVQPEQPQPSPQQELVLYPYSLRVVDDSTAVPAYPATAEPLDKDEEMIFRGAQGYHFDPTDTELLINDYEERLIPVDIQIKELQAAIKKLRESAKPWENAIKTLRNGGTPQFVVVKKATTTPVPNGNPVIQGAA
jgi:hypothetical protein